MSNQDRAINQAFEGLGLRAGACHPRAYAFFNELAEERRMRRLVKLNLEAGNPLFQAWLGRSEETAGDPFDVVAPLPGDKPTAGWVDSPFSSQDEAGGQIALSSDGPETTVEESSPIRFGLNSLHAWETRWVRGLGVEYATKWGVPTSILEGGPFHDADRLGARFVRQVGERDLLWSRLARKKLVTSSRELRESKSVPLAGDIPGAIRWGVPASGDPRNAFLLAQQFKLSMGTKKVLTFLTLGGGSSGGVTSNTPPKASSRGTRYLSSAVEYESSSVSPGAEIDWRASGGDFAALEWDEAHVGQAVTTASGDVEFPLSLATVARGVGSPPAFTLAAGGDWFFESLDPSCPYKRAYLGKIAAAMATTLRDAAHFSHYVPSDFVHAIEIFNEVDVRDYWVSDGAPDMRAAGAKWGRAYLHAAWNFREVLEDSEVQLWMPGMSSYNDQAMDAGKTWRDKLEFVEGFIEGIVHEATDFWYLMDVPDSDVLITALPTLLQGVDLHWYHRSASDTLHIGFLVEEIRELREAVTDALVSNLPEVVMDEFPEEFPVSVFENGWGLDNAPPAGVTSLSDAEKLEFQSWEVWRRLGGALAGNASIAGWHSWMSQAGGSFAKMGLREDTGAESDPAYDSTQRESWFAYSILSQVLGDTVYRGQMVLPAVSGRDELAKPPVGTSSQEQGMVVFEYQLSTGFGSEVGPWAYMVLRDPTVEQPTWVDFVLRATPGSVSSVEPIKVYYLGLPVVSVFGAFSLGGVESLPWHEVGATYTSKPVSPFLAYPSWKPVLYVSPVRLSWSLYEASGGGSGIGAAERLYQAPPWMDHPGKPLPGSGAGHRCSGDGRCGVDQ